jgi:hypothetical protein
MRGTKKQCPTAFKARITLEVGTQNRILSDLVGRNQPHSVQISQRKRLLLDDIKSFRDKYRRDDDRS